MFAEDVNGHKAGEIETLDVTKSESGITFTIMGLSPITIAFRNPAAPTETTTGGGKGANTGDTNSSVLWIVIIILCLMAGGTAVLTSRRRKRSNH